MMCIKFLIEWQIVHSLIIREKKNMKLIYSMISTCKHSGRKNLNLSFILRYTIIILLFSHTTENKEMPMMLSLI